MDPAAPTLDAAVLLDRLARNELPRDFLLMAARGFLPFPQDELVAVLSHLSVYSDPEIVEVARKSLQDLPTRVVITFARAENVAPDHLDALSKATEDPAILEAILRNRATGDATIIALASHVSPSLQEVIVINQERIIRTPGILDALLANAEISPDVYRRVVETREEFFEKRDRAAERAALLAETELDEAEKAEFADLLAEAAKLDAQGVPNTSPEQPPSGDPENVSAWSLIFHMTISQKVQLALKGNRTQRSILIRERNRLVVAAVVRSPRMSEPEAEAFAGMRNIDDEALRIIGMNRHWMSKYPIMAALVKNPKTPVGVVLPLINRLTLRDLKGLQADKGVSEAVRQQARKLYQTRRVS